jgi:SAM-dependent methyltransferase
MTVAFATIKLPKRYCAASGKGKTLMRIQKRVWSILIFLTVVGVSIAGYSQERIPDVHFEATPMDVVEAMLKMAEVTKDDLVYDLGCGDGRFVIMAAKKFGARGVGVDIDPERIRESNENARREGVTDRVKFIEADLFKTDIRGATVVTLYLLNELNLELRPKLLSELEPGARVVSHTFDMGDWEPDTMGQMRNKTIYYWVVPANVAGTWRWHLASSTDEVGDALVLNQEFQEVRGKCTVQWRPLRIREVRLRGDQLSFRVRYNVEGQNVLMRFKGRVSGDKIKGTVDIQGEPWTGTHEWTAERVKE